MNIEHVKIKKIGDVAMVGRESGCEYESWIKYSLRNGWITVVFTIIKLVVSTCLENFTTG